VRGFLHEKVFGVLSDERGFYALLWVLIAAPLLLTALVSASGVYTSVYTADVDAQEALAFAVKAAAMQVLPAAQAAGDRHIYPPGAHAAFRAALAANMGLDPSSLQPLNGSPYASAPKYWLVVYNGSDKYSAQGALGARMYTFDGEAVTESAFPYSGFPAYFAVSDSGVASGSGGTRTVKLETQGAVALIEATAKRVLGQGTITLKRWAAARVVDAN